MSSITAKPTQCRSEGKFRQNKSAKKTLFIVVTPMKPGKFSNQILCTRKLASTNGMKKVYAKMRLPVAAEIPGPTPSSASLQSEEV